MAAESSRDEGGRSKSKEIFTLVENEHGAKGLELLKTAIHLKEKMHLLEKNEKELVQELVALYDALLKASASGAQGKNEKLLKDADIYFLEAQKVLAEGRFPSPKHAKNFTGEKKEVAAIPTVESLEGFLRQQEREIAGMPLSENDKKKVLNPAKKSLSLLIDKLRSKKFKMSDMGALAKAQGAVVEAVLSLRRKYAASEEAPASASVISGESSDETAEAELVPASATGEEEPAESVPAPDRKPNKDKKERIKLSQEEQQGELSAQIENEIADYVEPRKMLEKARGYIADARTKGGMRVDWGKTQAENVGTGFYFYAWGENNLPEEEAERLADQAVERFKVLVENYKGFFNENGPKALALSKATLKDAADGLDGRKENIDIKNKSDDEIFRLGRLWFAKIYEGLAFEEAGEIAKKAAKAYRDKNSPKKEAPKTKVEAPGSEVKTEVKKEKIVPRAEALEFFAEEDALDFARETVERARTLPKPQPRANELEGKTDEEVIEIGARWYAWHWVAGCKQNQDACFAFAKEAVQKYRNSLEKEAVAEAQEGEKMEEPLTLADAFAVLDNSDRGDDYINEDEGPVFDNPLQAYREAYYIYLKKTTTLSNKEAGQKANEARDRFRQEIQKMNDNLLSKDKEKILHTAEEVLGEAEYMENEEFFPKGTPRKDSEVVYQGAFLFAKHFATMSREDAEAFAMDVQDDFEAEYLDGLPGAAAGSDADAAGGSETSQGEGERKISPESLAPFFEALQKGDFSTYSLKDILKAATDYLSQPELQQDEEVSIKGKPAANVVGIARFWSANKSGITNEAQLRRMAQEAREAYESFEKLAKPQRPDRTRVYDADEEETEEDRRAAAIAAGRDPGEVSAHYYAGIKDELRQAPPVREGMARVVDRDEVVLSDAQKDKIALDSRLKNDYYGALLRDIQHFAFKKPPTEKKRHQELNVQVFKYFNDRYENEVKPLIKEFEAADAQDTANIKRLEAAIKRVVKEIDRQRMEIADLDMTREKLPDFITDGVEARGEMKLEATAEAEVVTEQEYIEKTREYVGLVADFHEFIGKFSRVRSFFPDLDQALKDLSSALQRVRVVQSVPARSDSAEENNRRKVFVDEVASASKLRDRVVAVVQKRIGKSS